MATTSVPRQAPFTVEGDHDGIDTVSYQCRLNGAIAQTVPIGQALSNGVVRIPFPSGLQTVGSYTVDLLAVNAQGEVSPSDPTSECVLTITAKIPASVTHVRVALSATKDPAAAEF